MARQFNAVYYINHSCFELYKNGVKIDSISVHDWVYGNVNLVALPVYLINAIGAELNVTNWDLTQLEKHREIITLSSN